MIYLVICTWLCNVAALYFSFSRKKRRDRIAKYGWFALANAVSVVIDLLSGGGWISYLLAVANGSVAAWQFWLWWRGRRDKRRRAAALIGEKSRALRDALVRRMAQDGI